MLVAMNGLQAAIQIAGSRAALARKIKVTAEAVRKWERGRIPAERCLDVERATKGRVTRSDLRPDLWPPVAAPTAEAA